MSDSRLKALLDPSSYPDPTLSVRHIQTHISHIFITDNFVYKIKKAVDFGFLDFTTLEKRCFFCNEELRLNRRLSPDIYVAVLPLFDDGNGGLLFTGTGEPVEYAVKMLRLPEERMMSRLLDEGKVTDTHIEKLAKIVSEFHKNAETGKEISSFGTIESIRNNWQENFSGVARYIGRTISESDYSLIFRLVDQFIESHIGVFTQRVDQGFIRDCDGDLHSENICLDDKVHIFDCIEFSDKFRYSDTAADVAFLAMDLENHGRLDLSHLFMSKYVAFSGDSGLLAVLPLYLANRALIRGKVASLCLDDQGIDEESRQAAAVRAGRYFRLARGYLLRQGLSKILFITSGPTGCGKSTLASEFCFQMGIRHVSSDLERKRLANIGETERGADIYGDELNRATYDRLTEIAVDELSQGRSVLVDATFRTQRIRERFGMIAADFSAEFVIIRPVCSDERARRNIEARQTSKISASDGTWAVYQAQIADYEPPAAEEGRVIQLDAGADVTAMLHSLLDEVGLPG